MLLYSNLNIKIFLKLNRDSLRFEYISLNNNQFALSDILSKSKLRYRDK